MSESLLTPEERQNVVTLARSAVEAAVKGTSIDLSQPPFNEMMKGALVENRGAFVTLTTLEGRLRGCIGRFEPEESLAQVLCEMGEAAALWDVRFQPVTREELSNIRVEVSVLSPLRQNTWDQVRLGLDGILIKSGHRSGCFLPQVARETGWDLDTFLEECAVNKAGLSRRSWKNDAQLFTFTVEEIHEKK